MFDEREDGSLSFFNTSSRANAGIGGAVQTDRVLSNMSAHMNEGYSQYGFMMPSMTPKRPGIPNSQRPRISQMLVDPTQVDEHVRRQYAWFSAVYPEQMNRPDQVESRFYAHMYRESRVLDSGRAPRSLPEEIMTADRHLIGPTMGDSVRAGIHMGIEGLFGEQAGMLASQLFMQRGNRGPLGTALVNLGAMMDRVMKPSKDVYNQHFYRMGLKNETPETYTNVARSIADNAFNLGMAAAVFKGTMWLGETWARTNTLAGSGIRHMSASAQASSNGVMRTVGGSIGKAAEITMRTGFRFESNVTRGLIDLMGDVLPDLIGRSGQQMVAEMDAIYARDYKGQPLIFHDIFDRTTGLPHPSGAPLTSAGGLRDLHSPTADAYARATRGASLMGVFPDQATGKMVAAVNVMHDVTYLDRFKTINNVIRNGYKQVPIIGTFISATMPDTDPYTAEARAMRHTGYAHALRGRWAEAGDMFRQSYDTRRKAGTGIEYHIRGGGGPGAALAQNGLRTLMIGAVTSKVIGDFMAAPGITLQEQVRVENKIAGPGARSFGIGDLMPRSLGEVPQSFLTGLVVGASWLGQFGKGLLTGQNPFQAANEMNSVINETAQGNLPIRHYYTAGVDPSTVKHLNQMPGAILGFEVDKLTALARNMTMALDARHQEDLVLKVATKNHMAAMSIAEVERGIVDEARGLKGAAREAALETARFKMAYARQLVGQKEAAEVTLGQSAGIRAGDLRLGGVWAGGITAGSKTTFMMSIIMPMPIAGGVGAKFPIFHDSRNGRKNFLDWYNNPGKAPGGDSAWDSVVRAGVNATGGATGIVGSAAQGWMSFGYEQGTNWEAGARTAALGLGLFGGGSTAAVLLGGSALLALRAHKAGGIQGAIATQLDYYHTGRGGVSLDPLANIGRYIQGSPNAPTTAMRVLRGGVGGLLKIPGAILEAPLTAPFRAAAWVGGRGIYQPINNMMGGSFNYRTSHLATGVRAARSVVRGGLFGLVAFAGAAMYNAQQEYMRTDDGGYGPFIGAMQRTEQMLHGLPVIGGAAASFFKALTNYNDRAYWAPEQDAHFSSTPTHSFADSMHADKGKMKTGIQGMTEAFNNSFGMLLRQVRLNGVQTAEPTSGSTGGNIAARIDGDTITFSDPAIRFTPFNNWLAFTSNTFITTHKDKGNPNSDAGLAQALGGTRKFVQNYTPGKSPAFMGKMFLADSPIYSASPALKIAMSQRHAMSRWALGAYPAEVSRYMGDYRRPGGRSRLEKFTTYTAVRMNEDGRVLDQRVLMPEVFRAFMKGDVQSMGNIAKMLVREASGDNPRESVDRIFKGVYQLRAAGFNPAEAEDDYAAFHGAPRSPKTPALRMPNNIGTNHEYTLNWFNLKVSQDTMAGLGMAMGMVGGLALSWRAMQAAERYRTMARNDVAGLVERYAPARAARMTSFGYEAYMTPNGERISTDVHSKFVLELPGQRGNSRYYGDRLGQPFVDGTHGGRMVSGFDKGRLFVTSHNTVFDLYKKLPHMHTAGQMHHNLVTLRKVMNRLDPGTRYQSPVFQSINNDLDKLWNAGMFVDDPAHTKAAPKSSFFRHHYQNLGTGRNPAPYSGSIIKGHDLALEGVMRRMLHAFPEVSGIAALDGDTALREIGQRGFFGRLQGALLNAGLTEEDPLHIRPSRPPGLNMAEAARTNDTRSVYRDVRNATRAQAARAAARVKSIAMRAASPKSWLNTATRGLALVSGAHSLYSVGKGLLGIAAGGDNRLTTQQQFAVQRDAAAPLIGEAMFLGTMGAVAATAFIPVVGPFISAGVLVGGTVAAMMAPSVVAGAMMKTPAERNGLESFAATAGNGIVGGLQAMGGGLAKLPGGGVMARATMDWAVRTQSNLTNYLYTSALQAKPKDPTDFWGGVKANVLGFLAESTENAILPLGEVYPESQANREGFSFSLISPLWAAKSPIFWGRNWAGPQGGGTGWIKDAGEIQLQRQRRLAMSADRVGASIFDMIARETMGHYGTGNDNPLDSSLQSLYMGTGKGTGGLGSAQERRAFQYNPVPAMDKIIRDELHRRSVLYEVSVLGAIGISPGYNSGGAIYGQPGAVGANPAYGGTGGGRGDGFRPAGPNNFGPMGPSLFPGTGKGPGDAPKHLDPFIREASQKYGVPEGAVRAILKIETAGYNKDAVSWVGARGMMQVMPVHWKQGEDWRDPRTNILKGVEIYARYNKQLKRDLKVKVDEAELWALTAAAYNSGPNVPSYAEGRVPNYKETQRYYLKFKGLYKHGPTSPEETRLRSLFESKAVPAILKGGDVTEILKREMGLDQTRAAKMANEVRNNLYNQGVWLPKDEPSFWQKRNPHLGRVAGDSDKATLALAASGVMGTDDVVAPGARAVKGKGVTIAAAEGHKVSWSSSYGWRPSTGSFHRGQDYTVIGANGQTSGAPVVSRNSGVVKQAGWIGGYGHAVIIQLDQKIDGKPVTMLYGHGSSLTVKAGQRIQAGELIMRQGNTGHSYGDHVHFEVQVGGRYMDPAQLDSVLPVQTKPNTQAKQRAARIMKLAEAYNTPGRVTRDTVTAKVLDNYDADTLTVQLPGGSIEKVRLLGIDAPELEQQQWGKKAREFTQSLIANGQVKLAFDAQDRDKYGRLLAYAYGKDGKMINMELAKEGYAFTLNMQPNTAHAKEFAAAKREAQEAKRNIWGKDGLKLSPYNHRRQDQGKNLVPDYDDDDMVLTGLTEGEKLKRAAQTVLMRTYGGDVDRFNREGLGMSDAEARQARGRYDGLAENNGFTLFDGNTAKSFQWNRQTSPYDEQGKQGDDHNWVGYLITGVMGTLGAYALGKQVKSILGKAFRKSNGTVSSGTLVPNLLLQQQPTRSYNRGLGLYMPHTMPAGRGNLNTSVMPDFERHMQVWDKDTKKVKLVPWESYDKRSGVAVNPFDPINRHESLHAPLSNNSAVPLSGNLTDSRLEVVAPVALQNTSGPATGRPASAYGTGGQMSLVRPGNTPYVDLVPPAPRTLMGDYSSDVRPTDQMEAVAETPMSRRYRQGQGMRVGGLKHNGIEFVGVSNRRAAYEMANVLRFSEKLMGRKMELTRIVVGDEAFKQSGKTNSGFYRRNEQTLYMSKACYTPFNRMMTGRPMTGDHFAGATASLHVLIHEGMHAMSASGMQDTADYRQGLEEGVVEMNTRRARNGILMGSGLMGRYPGLAEHAALHITEGKTAYDGPVDVVEHSLRRQGSPSLMLRMDSNQRIDYLAKQGWANSREAKGYMRELFTTHPQDTAGYNFHRQVMQHDLHWLTRGAHRLAPMGRYRMPGSGGMPVDVAETITPPSRRELALAKIQSSSVLPQSNEVIPLGAVQEKSRYTRNTAQWGGRKSMGVLPILALRAYTQFGSYGLNAQLAKHGPEAVMANNRNFYIDPSGNKVFLRNETMSMDITMAQQYKGLMQAGVTLNEDVTVYRLLSGYELKKRARGQNFMHDATFISTAEYTDAAYYKLSKMDRMQDMQTIKIPAGSKVVYLNNPNARFNYRHAGLNAEREVIILPGQTKNLTSHQTWDGVNVLTGHLKEAIGVDAHKESLFFLSHGEGVLDPSFKGVARVAGADGEIQTIIKDDANKALGRITQQLDPRGERAPAATKRVARRLVRSLSTINQDMMTNKNQTFNESLARNADAVDGTVREARRLPLSSSVKLGIGLGGMQAAMMLGDVVTLADKQSTREQQGRSWFNLSLGTLGIAAQTGSFFANTAQAASALRNTNVIISAAFFVPDTYGVIAGDTRAERDQSSLNLVAGGLGMAAAVGASALAVTLGAPILAVAAAGMGAGLVAGVGLNVIDHAMGKRVQQAVGSVPEAVRQVMTYKPKPALAKAHLGAQPVSKPTQQNKPDRVDVLFHSGDTSADSPYIPKGHYERVHRARSWKELGPLMKDVRRQYPNSRVKLTLLAHGAEDRGFVLVTPTKRQGAKYDHVSFASPNWVNHTLGTSGYNEQSLTVITEACNAAYAYFAGRNGLNKTGERLLDKRIDTARRTGMFGIDVQDYKGLAPSMPWIGREAQNYNQLVTAQIITGDFELSKDSSQTRVLRLDQLKQKPSLNMIDPVMKRWGMTDNPEVLALRQSVDAKLAAEQMTQKVQTATGVRRLRQSVSAVPGISNVSIGAETVSNHMDTQDSNIFQDAWHAVSTTVTGWLNPKKTVQVTKPQAQRKAKVDPAPPKASPKPKVNVKGTSAVIEKKHERQGARDATKPKRRV